MKQSYQIELELNDLDWRLENSELTVDEHTELTCKRNALRIKLELLDNPVYKQKDKSFINNIIPKTYENI
ncbi:MAG: hypothetical protein LBN95_09855 [Prevotellaceae bacterium]|jgi:hypothetical protein|nr:hypothetical protein [Prevotellaceae bacterium]